MKIQTSPILRNLGLLGLGSFVLIFLGLMVSTGSASAAGKKALRLYNGPPQGTWRPIANMIKQSIENAMPGVKVSIEPGGGLSNVIATDSGKGDIAMVASSATYVGWKGRPPFKKKMTNVRELAVLYPQAAQLMTFDQSIRGVRDLKGKRVSVMPRGYAAEIINRIILASMKMSYKDLNEQFLGELDSADAMRDGHLDAFMAMGDIPYAIALDLASTRKLRFIPLSAAEIGVLRKMNAGLAAYTIPGGTYSGMTKDYTTIATNVHLVARAGLPNDVARDVTKAIVEALPKFQKNFNSFRIMTPKAMAGDVGIPMHSGAAAYFQEAGISTR